MDAIDNIIDYLKQSPEHFVWIMQGRKYLEGSRGQNIYIEDFPNEDLSSFLERQIPHDSPEKTFEFIIEHRKQNGNGHKKNTDYRDVRIKLSSPYPVNTPVMQPQTPNYPVQYQQQAPQQQMAQQMAQQPFYGMGNPGMGQVGLGVAEFMDLKVDSKELKRVQELNQELKNDNQLLKHEIKKLEIDVRDLGSKLSIADQQKEMAVMMVQMDKKSFLDSPAIQSIIEQAPQIMAGIAQAKAGAPVGLSAPNPLDEVSDTKRQLINYIIESCTDEQSNHIASLVFAMQNNSDFRNDINQLINKHNGNANN